MPSSASPTKRSSAPSLAFAAKWLREVHRYNVRVNHCYAEEGWFYDCLHLLDWTYFNSDVYDTYEEAYAAGIEGVVDNLKGGEE